MRKQPQFKENDQIWQCNECGALRAWGTHYPGGTRKDFTEKNYEVTPLLNCARCTVLPIYPITTRHSFVRVEITAV